MTTTVGPRQVRDSQTGQVRAQAEAQGLTPSVAPPAVDEYRATPERGPVVLAQAGPVQPAPPPTFPPGERGGHDFAAWADPRHRAPLTAWVPPQTEAGLDARTTFESVASRGSARGVVEALDPNLVRAAAAHYDLDGRAIAVAIYEEAKAYIPGEGDLRFGPAGASRGSALDGLVQTQLRQQRRPGYGTFHDSTMAALNPGWSAGQRAVAQQYPQFAVPVIAQEMNAKAVLYEHLSGVSIRDNPAMLAWAYNTSMDNVRASAEAQRRRVAVGQTPNFNLDANRQLGSTVYNRLARSLGLTHEPDGKGMGNASQSDVVGALFNRFLSDPRPRPSAIPYSVNGIPYVPGAEWSDPPPPRG